MERTGSDGIRNKKKADGGQPPNRRVLPLTTRNPDPSGVAKALDTRNKKLDDSSTVQPLMAYTHDAEEQRVPVEHKGHKEFRMPANLSMRIDTAQKSQELVMLDQSIFRGVH